MPWLEYQRFPIASKRSTQFADSFTSLNRKKFWKIGNYANNSTDSLSGRGNFIVSFHSYLYNFQSFLQLKVRLIHIHYYCIATDRRQNVKKIWELSILAALRVRNIGTLTWHDFMIKGEYQEPGAGRNLRGRVEDCGGDVASSGPRPEEKLRVSLTAFCQIHNKLIWKIAGTFFSARYRYRICTFLSSRWQIFED
jgi:hypothetical protein